MHSAVASRVGEGRRDLIARGREGVRGVDVGGVGGANATSSGLQETEPDRNVGFKAKCASETEEDVKSFHKIPGWSFCRPARFSQI